MIQLVDAGWDVEFVEALRLDSSELRIICPFIKVNALDRLLSHHPANINVITRFNLTDFAEGVSDVAAMRRLLDVDANVRGVRNLHAKLYLFGSSRAIITSANLTEAGLTRNHEFGVVAEDADTIEACRTYFDDLWQRSGSNLTWDQVNAWDETVTQFRALGGRFTNPTGLGDFGVNAGIVDTPPESTPFAVANARQAFVKFLGESGNRVPLSYSTIDEIRIAGCHWAVAYPASKRPSGVEDDAVIFIARLTRDPKDILVFGRAIGMKHVPGRDDASPDDIALRPWKQTWPRYIRVHNAEFVAGSMGNGISLNKLMDTLGADSFAPTQRNAASGSGKSKKLSITPPPKLASPVRDGQTSCAAHLLEELVSDHPMPRGLRRMRRLGSCRP